MSKNLVDLMKARVAASGGSRKEILFFKEGTVKRVRFLQELSDGEVFLFHSDFNEKIYELCQDPEDQEDCPLCKEGVALKEEFVWSVYDYDSQEVKLLKTRITSQSPAPQLIEYFDEYGTMTDRDYKIKKIGKGQNSSYVVTPLEREKFKGKGKVYSREDILKIFKEAYTEKPLGKISDDDDEDEPKAAKTKSKKGKAKKERTLKDMYKDLAWPQLKDIALELGMTKKELKAFDKDGDELVDELFDSYEEDDLQELYDNIEPFDMEE